jgi:hypothetical protein
MRGALRIWDKLPESFRWPARQLPTYNASKGPVADVIACQFQRTLIPNVQCSPFHRTVVLDERGESISQLKQVEMLARRLNAVKAAHVLIMLVEALYLAVQDKCGG